MNTGLGTDISLSEYSYPTSYFGITSGSGGAGSTAGALESFGTLASVFGTISSSIGSYYQAKSQQYTLEAQANNLEFAQAISELNAKVAETNAQAIIQSGQSEVGIVTRKYGARIGSSKAAMAANGIQLGDGSAAEVVDSLEFAKDVDALTIRANSIRSAAGARLQGAGFSSQAALQGMSAANLRTSADTISPTSSAFTSLLNGIPGVAKAWYKQLRPELDKDY